MASSSHTQVRTRRGGCMRWPVYWAGPHLERLLGKFRTVRLSYEVCMENQRSSVDASFRNRTKTRPTEGCMTLGPVPPGEGTGTASRMASRRQSRQIPCTTRRAPSQSQEHPMLQSSAHAPSAHACPSGALYALIAIGVSLLTGVKFDLTL